MAGSPVSPLPEDDTRGLPSPEQLDAAARELNSGRLAKQTLARQRKAAGVPSIEELDAAANELRSGRLPLQGAGERPKPRPKRGILARPAPSAPLIEDLDAGAAELHSDRLPLQPPSAADEA